MHLTDNESQLIKRTYLVMSGRTDPAIYQLHYPWCLLRSRMLTLLGAPWSEVFERRNGGGTFGTGSERVRTFSLLLHRQMNSKICNFKKVSLVFHVMLLLNWIFLQLRGYCCSSGRGSEFFFTSTKIPQIKTNSHEPLTISAPRYRWWVFLL